MKMKMKLVSLTLAVALLCSMSATVFADDPPTTAAAGNLLDYAVETVVVPTALKMTLNPNGYPVTTKYAKAESFVSGKTYYTENNGTYTQATGITQFAADTTYYTAVQSTDQVVSFNYGIASKATTEKKVTISFAAAYTTNSGGDKTITFVDSKAKAQAYDATNNADGAKRGELKIYLEAVAASAVPTTDTYKKTTDPTVTDGKTYYTQSNGTYTKVASPAADALGTYYEATTTIGTEITASELADVTMTPATSGAAAFVAGTTNKADAKIAFKLAPATYAVKSGEIVDFTTTMSGLASKLEMTAVGDVTAFTLTGAINPDADWTKSEASAITITPTYAIVDADGSETASGGFKQISVAPAATAPSIATTSYTAGSAISIPVSLGTGSLAATSVTSVTAPGAPNTNFLASEAYGVTWNASDKAVELTADAGTWLATDTNGPLTITFNDTAQTSVEITVSAA